MAINKNFYYYFWIFFLLVFVLGFVCLFFWQRRQSISSIQDLSFSLNSVNRTIAPDVYLVYGFLPYWNLNKATLETSLTHVSYFSLPINSDGSLAWNSSDVGAKKIKNQILEKLADQKLPHQKLELTLTMMDQDEIELLLGSQTAQEKLITEIPMLIEQYPIDGINIDIEYVRESTLQMQQTLAQLAQEITRVTKVKKNGFHTSISVMGDSGLKPRLTNPKLLANTVDHIIIMAYDYHRRNSIKSGPISPLFSGEAKELGESITSGLKAFTDNVPAKKLLLGVPFYGYEWGVSSENAVNFTLPNSGLTASFARIQDLIQLPGTKRYFDPISLTPYLIYEKDGTKQQIYYEDATSLEYKLELVKQSGMGGIAIWALGYEGDSKELWKTIDHGLIN